MYYSDDEFEFTSSFIFNFNDIKDFLEKKEIKNKSDLIKKYTEDYKENNYMTKEEHITKEIIKDIIEYLKVKFKVGGFVSETITENYGTEKDISNFIFDYLKD